MVKYKVIKPITTRIRPLLIKELTSIEEKKKKFSSYYKKMEERVRGILHRGQHIDKDYFRMHIRAYASADCEYYEIPYNVPVDLPRKVADRLIEGFSFHEFDNKMSDIDATEPGSASSLQRTNFSTVRKSKKIDRVKMSTG